MGPTFDTMQQALDAGYSRVNRKTDKDVSGGRSFGYDWQNVSGQKTVDVWIKEAKNKGGKIGAVCPMYPPA